jgi:hypothetical protein
LPLGGADLWETYVCGRRGGGGGGYNSLLTASKFKSKMALVAKGFIIFAKMFKNNNDVLNFGIFS